MSGDPFFRWPDLDALFVQALEAPPNERDAFLAAACAGDGELRAELERLLAAHRTSGSFLEDRSAWIEAGTLDLPPTGTSDITGRRVAHYDIEGLLAAGGMGLVYRARDTRLDRPVTLKFLQPHLVANAEARSRFIQEAKAASALDHANICTIYEIGEADDGQVYIAMAYYGGETLQARLSRGALPIDEALRIASEIGAGLERAHEAGIVHRDLKPANVMLTERGDVKLLDFGIAKLEGGGVLTRTGATLGTVAYMSPEQLAGEAVDRQADIWALGVVMYEMLTGVRPFRGDHEQAVVYGILHERPTPISQLRNDTAQGLEAVVMRCLIRDREQRYAAVADVLSDLRAVRGGVSVRSSTAAAAVPPRSSRRVGAALLGLALVVGAIALAAVFLRAPQTVPFEERDWLLITNIENLTGDSLLDRTLDSWLSSGIGESRRINVFPENRTRVVLQHMERTDVGAVDEALGLEIAQRAGVGVVLVPSISRLDSTYRLTARLVNPTSGLDFDVVTETADGQREITIALNRVVAEVRRRLGESRYSMLGTTTPLPGATTASLQALKAYANGTEAWQSGRWVEAARAWQEAVALDSTFARAHSNLGMYYYQNGDRIRGEEHFEHALAHLDRVSRGERLWIRSQIEGRRGNLQGAIQIMETLVDEYPDYQSAWFNLGSGYMRLRDCSRAEAALDQVLRIDPSVAQAHIQVATCYSATGKYELALERYEQAFAVDSALLTWPGVNHEYGNALIKTGQLDRAESVFNTMIRSGAGHRATGLRSLGLLEMRRGRFTRAVSVLEQSTSVYHATCCPLSEVRNRLYLAVAHGAIGDANAFHEQLAAAAAIADSITLEPQWLGLLGRLYARGGDPDAAARFLTAMEAAFSDQNAEDYAVRDLLRGEIEMARGNASAAVTALERANANRDDALYSESLARAYALNGNVDQAIAQYVEMLSQYEAGWEAQHPWIVGHFELARLYEAKGDYERAIEFYGRFVEMWSDADADAIPSVAEARRRIDALRRQHGIG
jgi:eukaryotic-like serine/threonine-protein kinase